MKQLTTRGIILSRTDYGEADRIITMLTTDAGKLRLMARGVRRVKSKLAGGVELFSISDITYIRGKGDIGTLISARLDTYYSNIVKDVNRTMLGYELIKQLHRATEDEPEPEYFTVLERTFDALNTSSIPLELIQTWFGGQLIRLAGHAPNLRTDTSGADLSASGQYTFDHESMAFSQHPSGHLQAKHIKALRLLFHVDDPRLLHQVQGLTDILPELAVVIRTAQLSFIRS